MGKRSLRQRTIERLRRHLLRHGAPRFLMGVIVAAAASIGLLSSMGLLFLGLHSMWLRYVLSACVGYASFLGLIWTWLGPRRGEAPDGPDASDVSDALDLADSLADVAHGSGHAISHAPVEAAASGGGGGFLDFDLGLDELVVVVLAGAAVVAGLIAAGYVVLTAPSLFAEVLADGAISYGFYRRLRDVERHHWIESAISRTGWPFVIVVVFLALAGLAMQWYAPEADSIGDVWLR